VEAADRTAQAQAIDALNAQIQQQQQQQTLASVQLTEEERQAKEQLKNDVIAFEQSIRQARGQTFEATRVAIAQEIEQDRQRLAARSDLTAAEKEALLTQKQSLLENRAQFDELSAQAQRVFEDVARQRGEIEQQASQGLISQQEAENQILALEQSRLPMLQTIADEMQRFAVALGDPALIQAAQALNAALGGFGVKIDEARVAVANFREAASQAIANDLIQFLGSGINQVRSLGDAFRSLALSIVQSLQQIIAKIIVLQILKSLGGALGGGAGGAANMGSGGGFGGFLFGLIGGALGGGGGMASGGLIRGPGTSTSDSIPAMLSVGEFVINARAVSRIGPEILAQLNAGYQPVILHEELRRRHVQHFAEGGMVKDYGPLGPDDPAYHGSFEGTIKLDDGLIMEKMSSAQGTHIIVKRVAENRKAILRALGIHK
jgi:hypothetical protein